MKSVFNNVDVEKMINLVKFELYWVISNLFEKHTYTVRYGLLKGLKRKGGLGFIPRIKMTEEEKFLASLNLRDKIVFDAGAYTGLYTIFFARNVGNKGKVISFEPNPYLCQKIKEHVKLNNFHNVKVMQLALGRRKEKAILAFPIHAPGVGSIEGHEKKRILRQKKARIIEVQVDSIDNLIMHDVVPIPDLVKVDVQGAEFDVILGMYNTIKKYKPKILVEVHSVPNANWRIKNLKRIADFLRNNGYSLYHIESASSINLSNINRVGPDEHLWCT